MTELTEDQKRTIIDLEKSIEDVTNEFVSSQSEAFKTGNAITEDVMKELIAQIVIVTSAIKDFSGTLLPDHQEQINKLLKNLNDLQEKVNTGLSDTPAGAYPYYVFDGSSVVLSTSKTGTGATQTINLKSPSTTITSLMVSDSTTPGICRQLVSDGSLLELSLKTGELAVLNTKSGDVSWRPSRIG